MSKKIILSIGTLMSLFASISIVSAAGDQYEWKSLHENAKNEIAIDILENAVEEYRSIYDKERNAIPLPKPGFFHEPNQLRQHYSFAFGWTTDIADYDWWKTSAEADLEIKVVTSATQWEAMKPKSEVSTTVGVLEVADRKVAIHTQEPNSSELNFVSEMFCEGYRGQVSGSLFFRQGDFPFEDALEVEKMEKNFIEPFAKVFFASEICKGDGAGVVTWGDFVITNNNTNSVPFESGEKVEPEVEVVPEVISGKTDDEVVETVVDESCFSDTKGEKFEDAICYVKENGIVEGYEDKSFKPNQEINRAEFAKIVIGSEFTEEMIGEMGECFSDVKKEWFAKFVCFAREKNIIEGYGDKTFKPENKVNLAEALKIVFEGTGYEVSDVEGLWYQKYINEAGKIGLFEKVNSDPAHNLTRGEMAEIIQKVKK